MELHHSFSKKTPVKIPHLVTNLAMLSNSITKRSPPNIQKKITRIRRHNEIIISLKRHHQRFINVIAKSKMPPAKLVHINYNLHTVSLSEELIGWQRAGKPNYSKHRLGPKDYSCAVLLIWDSAN